MSAGGGNKVVNRIVGNGESFGGEVTTPPLTNPEGPEGSGEDDMERTWK